jgi:hypothetical protein
MSQHPPHPGSESFEERLQQLRLKIDLLPARQRSHLCELADIIEKCQRLNRKEGQSPHVMH